MFASQICRPKICCHIKAQYTLPLNTARQRGRHFGHPCSTVHGCQKWTPVNTVSKWTPVNTARVNACDTLVHNQHGPRTRVFFFDTRAHRPCPHQLEVMHGLGSAVSSICLVTIDA